MGLRARGIVERIKEDREVSPTNPAPMIDFAIERLLPAGLENGLAEILQPQAMLVPIPRRAPLLPKQLWPPLRIAQALHAFGVGAGVLPCVTRTKAVPSSRAAGLGNRPQIETHYESFSIDAQALAPASIVLIDDVVTRGRTAVGAALRLGEAFPGVPIRLFAMARTRGLAHDVPSTYEYFVGKIKIYDSDCDRAD